MWTEFLLVSGWVFWIIIFAVICLEVLMLSTGAEESSYPVALAVITIIFVVLFTDAFREARLAWLIVAFALYLTAGTGWALKKWIDFVKEKRRYWLDIRDKDISRGVTEIKSPAEYLKDKRPQASEHKQRLITWMATWPFSMSWWLLTYPRRVFNWLYDRLATSFDRISERIFSQ